MKRVIGTIFIIGLLMLAANSVQAAGGDSTAVGGTSEAPTGTSQTAGGSDGGWTKFVIYVREGPVEGAVVGGKCKGDGSTVGCARRRAAPPGALLDGECWITVREWNSTTREIVLKNWGHELGHCTGKHHDDKGNWYE